MDAKAFFELVTKMREAQKSYFQTRSQSFLTESKRLETMVDHEIKRVNDIVQNHNQEENTLF